MCGTEPMRAELGGGVGSGGGTRVARTNGAYNPPHATPPNGFSAAERSSSHSYPTPPISPLLPARPPQSAAARSPDPAPCGEHADRARLAAVGVVGGKAGEGENEKAARAAFVAASAFIPPPSSPSMLRPKRLSREALPIESSPLTSSTPRTIRFSRHVHGRL